MSAKSSPIATVSSGSAVVIVSIASFDWYSATLEDRGPLLVERLHAFDAVFGRDEMVVGLDLEAERSAQLHLAAVADRLLDLPHRQRRVGRDGARGLERLWQHVGRVAEAVDEPPARCVVGTERLGRHDDFLG